PLAHLSRVDLAGNSKEHIRSAVSAVHIPGQIVSFETAYGLSGSDDRAPERMMPPALLEMQLVNVVARFVLAPFDLLDHDARLTLKLGLIDKGMQHHVREHVDSVLYVVGKDAAVVASRL